jgi:hypothetical protein
MPEFADQPWWPRWARDAMTGYLHAIIVRARPYDLVLPRLSALLRATGSRSLIDLCSGAGGPWPELREKLAAAGAPVEVTCTDLEPNHAAAARLGGAPGLQYRAAPVSALAVPADLRGARTMFSALHHFDPGEIRRILADAQAAGDPFAAFEATSRSARGVLATLVIPIAVLLLMPTVRPRDWRALLFTYLIPILPLAIWWDGLASTLRTCRVDELRAIVRTLLTADYEWQVEEIGGGPLPVLAVIGRPGRQGREGREGREGRVDG